MAYRYSYSKTPCLCLKEYLLCLLNFKTGSLCTFWIELLLVTAVHSCLTPTLVTSPLRSFLREERGCLLPGSHDPGSDDPSGILMIPDTLLVVSTMRLVIRRRIKIINITHICGALSLFKALDSYITLFDFHSPL